MNGFEFHFEKVESYKHLGVTLSKAPLQALLVLSKIPRPLYKS